MSNRASAMMRWAFPCACALGALAWGAVLILALALTLRDHGEPRRVTCYAGHGVTVAYRAVVKWDWRDQMVDAATGAVVVLPYGACVFDSVEGK